MWYAPNARQLIRLLAYPGMEVDNSFSHKCDGKENILTLNIFQKNMYTPCTATNISSIFNATDAREKMISATDILVTILTS